MDIFTPPCPNCKRGISFKQAQWGYGKPFNCQHCQTKLLVPKNYWLPIICIIAFWGLKPQLGSGRDEILLILAFIIIAYLHSRFLWPPRKL